MADNRRGTPAGVSSILEGVLARIDPDRKIALWRGWSAAVGEPIASHTRPDRLEDGVLVVRVDSHAWAQELQHLKRDLIGRLNDRFGAGKVREIYFVADARDSESGARRRRT